MDRPPGTVTRVTRRVVPPRLDIRLLGPPEVAVDGRPLVVDTRKAVAILAVLAADDRAYAREELAALLWPDSDDTSGRGALRRTLSALRAAIGDGLGVLRVERELVALGSDGVRVDIRDLERLASAGPVEDLAAAAALARGPFLAGFTLRDSPEFDDWRAARASAVERTVLGVLDRLATALEASGDATGAITAAARRLDLDPLDESGHVRLMDLHAAAGDRPAALRQYRQCVAVLERELGVAPLPSTTARYEAIRDAADTPARPTPRSDPTRPARSSMRRGLPLVGRDADITTVMDAHARAADGRGTVVIVAGEAGIGKTALGTAAAAAVQAAGGAVLLARAHADERAIAYGQIVEALRSAWSLPDIGARIDGLDPLVRAELARLMPSLARGRRSVDPRGDGPGAQARLVAAVADGLTTLVAGPVAGLIWFDDLQWADSASLEAIVYLARRLEDRALTLLLTWRPEDLGLDAGRIADAIVRLPGVRVIELGRLDRSAIGVLAAAGDRALDDAALDALTAASEGLPLYVVEALAGDPATLGQATPGGVRTVLEGRLGGLDEMATQVLAAAAVIGRSFDQATVRYASGRSDDETVDTLEGLLGRGIIREDAIGHDFSHGALRDLVYERMSQARRRLLHRRVAEALRSDLAGSGRDDLARLASIAAHEHAAGRDTEAAEAYALAGRRAAEVYANREAIAHDEAALALGHPDAVDLHARIGALRTRLGDYDGAINAFETAAAHAPPDRVAELEAALGRVHLRRGDLAGAEHHLGQALQATDPRLRAQALVDRSIARRRSGDLAGARVAAEEAAALAESEDLVEAAGAADRMLGLLALDAGEPAAASEHLARALAAADADADPTAHIAALTSLALAEAAMSGTGAALAHLAEAVDVARRIGDRHLEAAVENHAADVLHDAGRDEESLEHLRHAVAAFAEVDGDPTDPDPGIWMLSAS